MKQDLTNPFKNLPTRPYCLICAGGGPGNVELPDGTITSADEVKNKLKYPQLFSWNAEQKQLLKWVSDILEDEDFPCKLVVDSGAYSAWSIGKEFDMDEYIDFLNDTKAIDAAFWVAEADVIPGSFGVDPTEEEILQAPEKSWENYLYMTKKVKHPKKILPIFHQGEDFYHLRRMLDYTFEDGDHIPYIGISPRNDISVHQKIPWYKLVSKIIKESANPNVLTHNFGMTSIALLEQFPSYSSDSTSWIRGASFGNIFIPIDGTLKSILVSNRRLKDKNHLMYQNKAVKDAVQEVCDEIGHGLTLDSLYNNDNGDLRPIINLYTLSKWSRDFEFKGDNKFKYSLWG